MDGTFNLSLSGQDSGTSVVYQVSTDNGANWSTTTAAQSALADASYLFRAVVTDAAGNSATSNAIAVVVDTAAPAAGTLAFTSLTDTGSTDTPAVTQDGTFNLSLSGQEPGTSVVYQVSTDNGAHWSTTTAAQSALADASYLFRAVVTDAAGNSATSNAIAVVVDTAAPAAGTLAFASLTDTGSTDTPAVTQDGTFNLSLSGQEPGTSVVYQVSTDNGAHWSTTTAAQSALADASYLFRAVVTDAAGNSATSNAIAVVVDTAAPTIAIGTIAGDNIVDAGEASAGFAISGTEFGRGRPDGHRDDRGQQQHGRRYLYDLRRGRHLVGECHIRASAGADRRQLHGDGRRVGCSRQSGAGGLAGDHGECVDVRHREHRHVLTPWRNSYGRFY